MRDLAMRYRPLAYLSALERMWRAERRQLSLATETETTGLRFSARRPSREGRKTSMSRMRPHRGNEHARSGAKGQHWLGGKFDRACAAQIVDDATSVVREWNEPTCRRNDNRFCNCAI
jgi:hypothetical protein